MILWLCSFLFICKSDFNCSTVAIYQQYKKLIDLNLKSNFNCFLHQIGDHGLKIPAISVGRLDDDIPTFTWQSLEQKKKIGSGSFRAVYKAKYEHQDVAIKKSVEQYDDYYKRVFIKECKLLFSITHRNIVKFKAVCLTPLSVMLELCFFDFTPFG